MSLTRIITIWTTTGIIICGKSGREAIDDENGVGMNTMYQDAIAAVYNLHRLRLSDEDSYQDLDKQDWAAANGYSYPLEEDIEIYYRMVFE